MSKPKLPGPFLLLLAPLLLGMGSCAELSADLQRALATDGGAARALAPTVSASDVRLRRSPSLRDLAAYYCPVFIQNQIAQLACAATLGPPPSRDRLTFEFGIAVAMKNPNNIPIPALDVLLATQLFAGQDTEGLGAICVSLCGSGDPSCNGAPRPGSCTSSQNDIRRIQDFAARVPGLIAGLVTGAVQNELRKSTIAARGDVRLDLAFVLGIDQALRVLEKATRRAVDELLAGRQMVLDIPVSAQGTVFVQLPAVGRLGVGFGPLQTVWHVN